MHYLYGVRRSKIKIGFSFGNCLADIVKGIVDYNDVMLIVARTNMRDVRGVMMVIDSYLDSGALYGLNSSLCQEIGVKLWENGKIIEPRANGVAVLQVPSEYRWMDLFPTEVDYKNEGTREAWNAYRMMIGLSVQVPEQISENSVVAIHGPRINT